MDIAESAIATARDQMTVSGARKVADQRAVLGIVDLRAHRNLQHDILALGAGALAPHAVHAGPGPEVLAVAIVDQRVQPLHGFCPDIAATAAIAAVRSAELDEFLAAERDAAGAAIAGTHVDFRSVEKFHPVCRFMLRRACSPPRRSCRDARRGAPAFLILSARLVAKRLTPRRRRPCRRAR